MGLTLISDLKKYQYKTLVSDIIAGLTVTIILIPQGMAYALLAGLPPVYGLYAAIVPLVIYPFFASSRELSIGPVALMSIIILSGVSVYAEPGTPLYIDLVLMTALISGLLQVLYAVFKWGKLSRFLSKPVTSGFIAAAAVIIAISQLKYLLTLNQPRCITVPELIQKTCLHLPETNFYSLAMGGGAILLLLICKRIHKAIPGALIVVILGSLLLYYFNLQNEGIPIVGDLPQKLPSFYAEFWHWDYAVSLLPASFIISLICFIGSFSIAKSLARQNDDYPIKPNRELLGLGLAKMAGSFFLAMPSTGSFTRSVINDEAGAQTGIANLFTVLFVSLTLLFFGYLFYYLPEPVLAAIVITSVFSLIDIKDTSELYRNDKQGFLYFMVTFLSTLMFGIVDGILIGIGFSIIVSFLTRKRNNIDQDSRN